MTHLVPETLALFSVILIFVPLLLYLLLRVFGLGRGLLPRKALGHIAEAACGLLVFLLSRDGTQIDISACVAVSWPGCVV